MTKSLAPHPSLDASGLRATIVAARFNAEITEPMTAAAIAALTTRGAATGDIRTVWVPGAFEIPVVLEALARVHAADLYVAIGCVVRGDTPHFDFVATACTDGCAAVARQHGVAVGFGVITTETWEQAQQRAGGSHGNKGEDAALAALETAQVLRAL